MRVGSSNSSPTVRPSSGTTSVRANGVVLVGQAGDVEVGADAVGAGDQVGILEGAVGVGAEGAGEASEAVEHARAVCALQERDYAGQALLVQFQSLAGVTVSQL